MLIDFRQFLYDSVEKVLFKADFFCMTEMRRQTLAHNLNIQCKKISNDQELIQSDPISCPQNQKGNN